VVELARLAQLLAGQREAFLDLAFALGRTLAKPPLVLGEGRSLDEDRDRSGDAALLRERATVPPSELTGRTIPGSTHDRI